MRKNDHTIAIINNYTFFCGLRKTTEHVIWQCSHDKCQANFATRDRVMVSMNILHNHSLPSNGEVKLRRRRVTTDQLEAMFPILNSNKEFALGYNKSAEARVLSKRMWRSVAEALNFQKEGSVKDWRGWSNR
ncbi:uncharacterized protein LOC119190010 [Manduca sexta]|uniref:uncharacterized protein LOC119190010 n=1 Tax=Manduca sexta TaxID=7130 RepID=UPI00188E5E59|nr:uncharacterized protein LOC119190010 [Manduca sexta]